jgi:threonine dehydrogenase-like Zn-dependent dehydrogenase
VKELTNGRGADTVIEGVGHADALKTGFDLLRPWGNISSFGVHNEEIPWTGNQAYGKNLRIQMGRCPVRSKTVHACFPAGANSSQVFFLRLLRC